MSFGDLIVQNVVKDLIYLNDNTYHLLANLHLCFAFCQSKATLPLQGTNHTMYQVFDYKYFSDKTLGEQQKSYPRSWSRCAEYKLLISFFQLHGFSCSCCYSIAIKVVRPSEQCVVVMKATFFHFGRLLRSKLKSAKIAIQHHSLLNNELNYVPSWGRYPKEMHKHI